jgi:DNA-binding NarL/FixJ family response regulator
LDRLELEHNNLRAALQWTLEQHETETALRFGSALWRFWMWRGYLSEGNRWLTLVLDKAEMSLVSIELKAKALHSAGLLAMYQGDFRRAEAVCSESLALCRERTDQVGIAAALQGLAQVAMRRGQFATARTMREESLSIYHQLDDPWGIANTLVYLGLIDWMQGEYGAARQWSEEGLACFRVVGDPQGIAQALQSLGWIMLSLDDGAAARSLLEESRLICQASGDRAGLARSLTALGMVAVQQGDHAVAHTLLEESLIILVELGDKFHLASCLGIMTALAVAAGRPMQAVQLYSATDTLMTALGAAVPAYFRASLERSLASARSQLDAAAFADTLAAGQKMTPEQILAMPLLLPEQPNLEPTPSPDNYPADLTGREVEVLRWLAQGLTNAQIAERLIVSPYTVNAHLRHIFNKLDVPTRAAATRYAIEHNLV